jgi:hypothetical protein
LHLKKAELINFRILVWLNKTFLMKTLLFLSIFLLGQAFCFSQTASILFVNDNAVYPANSDTLLFALSHSAFPVYDIFNARDSIRSPDYPEIMDYDLVIWYCASDGVGNYFWEGNDIDNFALKQYLDNGGKLWVMGTDFLFDRYTAPQDFVPGDFVYDYLGISEYHAQSYGDDGGLGVSELDPVGVFASTPVIQWVFPTAWWVDACLPAPGTHELYRMGPAGYAFDSYYSGFLLDTSFTSLSLCFDPAIIDTYANRLQMTNTILNYLLNVDAVPEIPAKISLGAYPNPATDLIKISLNGPLKPGQYLQLADISGRILQGYQQAQKTSPAYTEWTLDLRSLSPGTYFCRVVNSEPNLVIRLVKGK